MGTTAKTLLAVALTLVIAANTFAHGIMHEPPHGEKLKLPQLVDARIYEDFERLVPQCDATQEISNGDPVLPVNGELRIRKVDLTVPSLGFPFTFVRCYRSGAVYDGPLGQKWDFNFNSRLVLDTAPTPYTIERYDGANFRMDVFSKNTTTNDFDAPTGVYEKIVTGSYGYDLVDAYGGKLVFELSHTTGTKSYYRLKEIRDRNSRSMTLAYSASGATGRLTTVTDTNSRTYSFYYDANGRLVDLCGWYVAPSLAPGEDKPFKVACGGTPERPAPESATVRLRLVEAF